MANFAQEVASEKAGREHDKGAAAAAISTLKSECEAEIQRRVDSLNK
jgi:hypothetical protein